MSARLSAAPAALSPALARVAAANSCSGCGLCAALAGPAIILEDQAPGWLRPRVHSALPPDAETRIEAACPGLRVPPLPPAPVSDPLWGPVHEIATGHATDQALRHTASSGGALSALLVTALQSGLVDHIVQTTADPERPLANRTVISRSPAEIAAAAGSRYAPSAPLAGLRDWLALPGRIAFVGKPCDVAALRALAILDPGIAAKVPLMLSFFCAGIPSHAAGTRILDRLGVAPARVRAFRYRGDGWPGFATATLDDGSTARMSYAASWGDILSKEVQFRCKICPDAVGGQADLVAADAWDCDERGYPRFDEADGRSLVIARTAAGQALLDAARASGQLATGPLALRAIDAMQPHQARRKREVAARLAAMQLAGRPRLDFAGNLLEAAAAQAPLPARLRAFLGLLRRFIMRRA